MVLMALTCLVSLLFLSLTTSTQHLQLSSKLERRARARDAAKSMLHAAIAELSKDDTFGLSRPGAVLRLGEDTLGEGCSAVLSFDPLLAKDAGARFSTNNLQNDSSVEGDARVVPRRACQLVAVGRCFNEGVQLETLFLQPPFPTGCASKGPITFRSVQHLGAAARPPSETTVDSRQ